MLLLSFFHWIYEIGIFYKLLNIIVNFDVIIVNFDVIIKLNDSSKAGLTCMETFGNSMSIPIIAITYVTY